MIKLLVTGGAGFIGSNFIKYWMQKYPEDKILNLDLLTYAGNLDNLSDIKNFNYQFVKGEEILKWAEKANKKSIIKVLKAVIKQCEAMDILMVNKKEMNHPYKHILISNDKPVMIDFERCKLTSNPKNVNQFFQFLINSKMSSLLKEKGIIMDKKEVQALLKEYKKTRNKKTLNKLLSFLN